MPSISDLVGSQGPTPDATPDTNGGTILDRVRNAFGGAGDVAGDIAMHPGRAAMNALNAPGRASKSLLAGRGVSAMGGDSDDTNRAEIRHRMGLDDPTSLVGRTGTYDQAPQWLKGIADFGIDTLTDPMTYVPGEDLLKVGGRAASMLNRGLHVGETLERIPGVKAGAQKVGDTFGSLFDPHHATSQFTEHGQNLIDRATNVHGQAAARAKVAEERLIATHHAAIRAGHMPDDVKALFAKYGADLPKEELTTPRALRDALDTARDTITRANIKGDLRAQGLLADGSTGATRQLIDRARGHDAYFKDPTKADEARASLAEALAPKPPGRYASSVVGKAIGATNVGLKTAFLALPGAHMANLANLAYNSHGADAAVHGLLRAIPIALGKEGSRTKALVDTLDEAGAHNQYAPLYQEANKFAPMRAGARALNALQDKTLNAYETGLRATMLEKDLRAGKSVEDSVRGIHRALGSDPNTGLTEALSNLPASQFPRFHTQTAIGSTLRTLREHPGRITTAEHALGMAPDSDENEPTATGDAVYHLSTPTAAFLRMMDNPYKYFTGASTLGKIAGVTDTGSVLGALIKGNPDKARQAAIKAAFGIVPGAELGRSLLDIGTGDPGQAGESGQQDLLSALLGGYYATK